jgi:hypothetical protein
MSQKTKFLEQVLSGRADANINFNQLLGLLRSFEFEERIKGSHHIFTRSGVGEILNLQPKGAKAKSYQVKQVRQVILKYRLGGDV